MKDLLDTASIGRPNCYIDERCFVVSRFVVFVPNTSGWELGPTPSRPVFLPARIIYGDLPAGAALLRERKNKTGLAWHLLNVVFLLHYTDFMEHEDYIYAHPS